MEEPIKPSAKYAPKNERYLVPVPGGRALLSISVSIPWDVSLDSRARKRAIKKALFAHTGIRIKTAGVDAILKYNRELFQHAGRDYAAVIQSTTEDAGEDSGATE